MSLHPGHGAIPAALRRTMGFHPLRKASATATRGSWVRTDAMGELLFPAVARNPPRAGWNTAGETHEWPRAAADGQSTLRALSRKSACWLAELEREKLRK